MTTPDTLLGAVADAIATADTDGATYEDLARAAMKAQRLWNERFLRSIKDMCFKDIDTNDQEDDGA